ncbi:MAG: HIT domain-containing protein [Candidatus Aenigmarchaeota archaeon]|nr:HIT domain-containing protein [Candidatus Aenigmarchaeota archaeon]
MEQKCIFCAIVANQIPALKVYEDDNFIAFLDIRPLTKGNCLVIPKKHYIWTYDVPNFGDYFEVARKVGLAAQKAFGAKWICFLTLGLEVQHAHIRVVPRYEKDLHGIVVDINVNEKFSEEEMKEIAEELKSAIPVEQPKVEEKKEEPVEEKPRWSKKDLFWARRDIEQT